MARCDEGYLCDVCGKEVENLVDSDLYLRFILGEIAPQDLAKARERHIRCHPETAQYIIDAAFSPVACPGFFAKQQLEPAYVREQEEKVTRAWQRLQEIPRLGIPITEYPLEEVRKGWRG